MFVGAPGNMGVTFDQVRTEFTIRKRLACHKSLDSQ